MTVPKVTVGRAARVQFYKFEFKLELGLKPARRLHQSLSLSALSTLEEVSYWLGENDLFE